MNTFSNILLKLIFVLEFENDVSRVIKQPFRKTSENMNFTKLYRMRLPKKYENRSKFPELLLSEIDDLNALSCYLRI